MHSGVNYRPWIRETRAKYDKSKSLLLHHLPKDADGHLEPRARDLPALALAGEGNKGRRRGYASYKATPGGRGSSRQSISLGCRRWDAYEMDPPLTL
jgi:hypothetical protein